MSEPAPAATPTASDAEPPRKKANVKAWLYGYLVFYVVMFVVYFTMLGTRSQTLKPEEWLKLAGQTDLLGGWRGELTAPDAHEAAELAQLYNKRREEIPPPGKPAPGEVRFIEPYGFTLPTGARTTIEADVRLTRAQAAALAYAIVTDYNVTKANKSHKPMGEMVVYRDDLLNAQNWSYLLTIGNLLGFFMLVGLFLWGPLTGWLGNTATKTTQALERAQAAQVEADDLNRKYATLREEVETRREQYEKAVTSDIAEERERIISSAKHEAQAIMDHLRASMDAEILQAKEKLKREVVREALTEARTLLEQAVKPEDHHQAVREFIDDVGKAKI